MHGLYFCLLAWALPPLFFGWVGGVVFRVVSGVWGVFLVSFWLRLVLSGYCSAIGWFEGFWLCEGWGMIAFSGGCDWLPVVGVFGMRSYPF